MDLLASVADKIDLEDSLRRASLQAQRVGLEGEHIAEIYSRMAALGIAKTAEEVEALTEQIGNTASALFGLTTEQAFEPKTIAEFMAVVQRGNLDINQALNLLTLAGGVTKDMRKGVGVVGEFAAALSDAKEMKAIRDAAHMTSKELNGTNSIAQNMMAIFKKGPQAIKPMLELIGPQARAGLEQLLGTEFIDKAIKGSGHIAKGEMEAAQDKIRDLFEREAAYKMDAAAAAEHNAKLMKTSETNMQLALNKLEHAFQSEEMSHAIETIASKLPIMADALAKFISFAVENPWTAITGAVAAKAGLAFAGAAVQTAVAQGAAAMFARMMAVQAASAAPVLGVGMTAAGTLSSTLATGKVAGLGGAAAAGAGTMAAGALAAGAVGLLGTTALLEAFGGDKILEQFGASLAGTGAPRAMGRGTGALVEGEKALQRGMPVTPAAGPSIAEREKAVAETERKLLGALGRIADQADGAAKGLGNVAKNAGGVPSSTARGTPKVPQQTGAAPMPQGA
jgi:hypothetical protein